MPLTPGTRLGPYEVLSALGAGGMGEVYRARDTKLNRDVAIKILPDLFARDPERLARFKREAQVLASLNHPNIAQIYGLEESGGLRALVMELVGGEDLSQRIVRGPILLADALAIARQIADALEAAHEQGIIHRDLKPANIKVRDDGTVKVLDFGLAKALDPAGVGAGHADLATLTSPAMTAQGIILGTAAYMSPEQARGKVVDKRADIWAFGCVVYETLTGKRAFVGETLTDVLAAVVKSDPDWQALPPDTPRSVTALLRRCLRKDPVRRLHDIADARIEIQDAIAEPETTLQTAPALRQAARWTVAIPWTLTAVLAIAVTWLVMHALRVVSPSRPVAHLELNLPPGVEPYTSTQAVAVSPDGARVAFIGIVAGYKQVYVRDLDKFDAVPVRGTNTATSVFFSPNGRAIGVILVSRVLEKVSLEDGLVVPLARGADIQRGGIWGQDDRITFARESVLWQVPASEGSPTQLTTLDAGKGELRHAFPTVVTGGKALLFTVATGSSPDAVHIEALSLVTHLRTEVGERGTGPLFVASGRLIFSRDGAILAAPFDEERLQVTGPAVKVIDHLRLSSIGQPVVAVSGSGAVAYMSGTTSVSQLVWVSRQGVEQPITDTDRMYDFPRLDPLDGRRVLVSANGDLWIKDTVGKAFTVQNTQTTTGNSYPVWTLDAKRVVFRTATGLYAMDVDRGRPQLIPGTTSNDYPSSVSRNGDTLIFIRLTREASGDVWALSLRGEPNPRALVSTPGSEGGPQLSPDGHWLVYASIASPTEPFQLFVSPFPGLEGRWPVSQSGMFPRWTKNGAELVYRDGGKMMAVEVSIKNDVPTFTSPQRLFDDRYLSGPSTSIPNYDVSPDGQRFVMVKGEAGSSRLNIVLNWFDELMRVAPAK